MPTETYYVALPFIRLEDGVLTPGRAVDCPSFATALRRAEALSRAPGNAGAIAFFRSGDENAGEFTAEVLIRAFGDVPDELSDL